MNCSDPKILLAGCSFTDPSWQEVKPWSVRMDDSPKMIVAKAGMGIKGISTETWYFLQNLPSIQKVVMMLPNLWRMDIEVDEETYLCNCMVDLLIVHKGQWRKHENASRKWIVSGGLHFDPENEQGAIFKSLYKHQGFLVILKEHLRSLKIVQDYCRERNIDLWITAIADPMDQFTGLDYIQDRAKDLLRSVNYDQWIRFDGQFIDQYLGHTKHPNDEEQQKIADYIKHKIEQI